MVSDKAIDSNEENCDLVKRKDQTNNMENKEEDTGRSTSENSEDDSGLSPAVMTEIMVSIGVGLFTVCALLFWICKAQLAQARKVQEKSALVESKSEDHDDSQNNFEKQKSPSLSEAKEDTGSIRGASSGHMDCLKHNSDNKEEISSIETKDSLDTSVNEYCSPGVSENKPVAEQLENTKEAASKIASVFEARKLEVLGTCEKMDTAIDSQQIFEDEGVTVQLGPPFNGNLSVSSSNKDSSSQSDGLTMSICNNESKPFDRNHKVLLQDSRSEKNSSISICCGTGGRDFDSTSVIEKSGKIMSPSLEHLTKMYKPNGALQSKADDMLFFPQDNYVATGSTQDTTSTSEQAVKTKFKQKLTSHKNLEISRSLDSQRKSIEKGCQLLQTRPFRSSLKMSGSDGSLKKYVHFPEDIRNIRKVYKYDSFDDSMLLHNYGEKRDED